MTEGDMAEDTSVIQLIINELKGSSPLWEDFVSKGLKLHASLRATAAALEAFLDSMLKIADAATCSKGASKDVGASLTKMVLRHRNIEQKLRVLTGLFGDSLILPLQEKIDEWKKSVNQFDKDNAKEFKKAKQDLKKVNTETIRLHNKVNKKGKYSQKDRLDAVRKMASAQIGVFEEHQKRALRKVLVEERSRYCILLNFLQPVVEQEVSLLSDAESLSSLLQEASLQCEKPTVLPEAGEHLIEEFKSSEVGRLLDEQITPPASPTHHRRHAYSTSSGTSSRSNSPPSRVSSPENNRTLSRSKSLSVPSSKPAPPVRRSSVLSPTREGYMDKNLGASRTSISSQSSTSNNSNYSSMSSLDSPYVDSLPPPPPIQTLRPPSYALSGEENLPPPPVDAIYRGRISETARTIDSGFYSSMSSSLDRSPSASLAQVPYDDNDSGHYEAVNDGSNSEGLYEYPSDTIVTSPKQHRSNSESLGLRGPHGHHFAKRSISFNDSETAISDWTDMTVQQMKRLGLQDNRGVKGLDLIKTSELSAQIAANAAEVAAHFQKKDESSEKWRPPVAKKNFFSPTSPIKSPDFEKTSQQMENPRRGVDNEFLDDSYKVNEINEAEQPSLLAQIQRKRSSMKYIAKQTR